MTDLPILADRVAQAEGADAELDFDIMRALGWREDYDSGLMVWYWVRPSGLATGHRRGDPSWLRYTASLDAAMSLVPEGHVACVANGRVSSPQIAVGGSAVCGDPAWTDTKPVEAATPALALCAAALRATHASGAGEG